MRLGGDQEVFRKLKISLFYDFSVKLLQDFMSNDPQIG